MTATCSYQGCSSSTVGRGLCATHYKAAVTKERRADPLPDGAILRVEREAAGMPPFVLADTLGISRALLCNWEKGIQRVRPKRWPAVHAAIAAYVPPGPGASFWPKVNKDGPIPAHRPELGPCWVWTGGTAGGGYGSACRDGGHVPAHRLAWELEHGPIPDGLNALHHCDNRPCVKAFADEHGPSHLFLGTQKVNVDDMVAKDRGDFWGHHAGVNRSRGETHHSAKLAEADVIELRRLYRDTPAIQTELARAFGVSHGLVSMIVTRHIWRRVP